MLELQATFEELSELVNYRISGHRFDGTISDAAIQELCHALSSAILNIPNKRRSVSLNAMLNANAPVKAAPLTANASQSPVQSAGPQSSKKSGEPSLVRLREQAIVGILGANSGETTINQVMAGLVEQGLADESQRGTIISMLRRMKLKGADIISRHDGHYELTSDGRDAYAQMTRKGARKIDV